MRVHIYFECEENIILRLMQENLNWEVSELISFEKNSLDGCLMYVCCGTKWEIKLMYNDCNFLVQNLIYHLYNVMFTKIELNWKI